MPKIKNPISDAKLGSFILSCVKTAQEAEELCTPKCSECGRELTQDERFILRTQGLDIPKEDLLCFIGESNCQDKIMRWKKRISQIIEE